MLIVFSDGSMNLFMVVVIILLLSFREIKYDKNINKIPKNFVIKQN